MIHELRGLINTSLWNTPVNLSEICFVFIENSGRYMDFLMLIFENRSEH